MQGAERAREVDGVLPTLEGQRPQVSKARGETAQERWKSCNCRETSEPTSVTRGRFLKSLARCLCPCYERYQCEF